MSSVAASLSNHSIYVFLNLRGAEPGFHWGLFVPTHAPHGAVWHAVNRTGGWFLEANATPSIPNPMSLCLVFKTGAVDATNFDKLKTEVENVPASGEPSPYTGEAFSCRVWVKDALAALDAAGLIGLERSTTEVEEAAVAKAEANREAVELGTGGAVVWNDAGFSTAC
ncbi:hypothetical protein EDC01DRAFT_390457 [Geopyxis carbonaria]|nr:hypothetical protein EDC01DRAFT_390457 [Geopyxis carbonaria]